VQEETDASYPDAFSDDSSRHSDDSQAFTKDDENDVDFSPDIENILSNSMAEAGLDFYAHEGLDAWRDNEYVDIVESGPNRISVPSAHDDFVGLSLERL